MSKYKLQFFRKISDFVGTLKLFKNGVMVPGCKWEARSGQPGYRSYWTNSKSPVPASDAIEDEYSVNPGYAPGDVSACGDTFYHIFPDPIKQKGGDGRRGEVGIHSDANIAYAPGTAGCIGVAPRDWDSCRDTLDAVFAQECAKNPGYRIPLEVIYG